MPEESTSQERAVRRVALCIGIGTYTNLPNQGLRYAVADAQAMAKMLGDKNRGPYEVTLLTELLQTTKQQVQETLFRVLHTPSLRENDLVLISISCHGALSEDGQTFYLLPSDAMVKPDRQVDPTTILDIYDLTQVLAGTKVNNCIFLLDICHSGGAGAIFRHLPLNLSADTNLFIIGAARQDQPAWQSSVVKHGFFTHAVLKAFEQQPDFEGWVTINQVLDFVSKEIRQRSSAEVARIQITSSAVDPGLPILRNPYYVPITNVPFSPSPFFLGREDILEELKATFQVSRQAERIQPQALCGLGGIGKTQLALEYARRARKQYQAILWANAETRESLLSSFVQIAQVLNLPFKEEQDQMLIVEGVKHWLETQTRWLLILDNVEDPTVMHEFLPSNISGHLLLTTRASTLGTVARSLAVESLDSEHSMLLVLRRGGLLALNDFLKQATEQDQAAARELVKELAGLPLALDQAGAYIDETGCSVAGYLHRYQQERVVVLKRRGRYERDYPQSVATTWSLSFEKVQQENPLAAEILSRCAFLHPDLIPAELVVEKNQSLTQVDEALAVLQGYSLIRRDKQSQMLTIHRLVQAVLRDSLPIETQQQRMQDTVLTLRAAFPDSEFEFDNWPICERLLSHTLVCFIWIEQVPIIIPEASSLLNLVGGYLIERANYSEVEPLLKRALAIREQQLGPVHPDTATSLNNLGYLYEKQGRYEEAEPLYQRALAIREQQLGPEHTDTAISLNSLGELYEKQGRYEEAEPLLKRALAIREQLSGPVHPDTAYSLNNLAGFYYRKSQYAKAEPLLKRALAIFEQQLGLEHPLTAANLSNLALLYEKQGRYEEAEPLLKRALAIREQQLGPVHPDTAISLNNLAGLYYSKAQYEKAEQLMKRVLAIYEQLFGPEHPDTVLILNNLAFLYDEQGQYAKAEPLYQRALEIRERLLGPEHPDLATSLNNLAVFYNEQGQYAKAEPLLKRALAIREQQLGPDNLKTAVSLLTLAQLYSGQKQYEKAEPLLKHALAICEQQLGPEHPDTATSINNLASLYDEQGRYEEAEPLLKHALAIREQQLGPDHPDTAASLNNLAQHYIGQKQYEKAEPFLKRALKIYEQQLGLVHPDTASIINNLAFLYSEQGEYAKAEPLYQRALAIREQQLGPNHPDTATSINNLAGLYSKQQQHAKAEPLLKRALAIFERTLGLEHPYTQSVRNGYVFILRQLGRSKEAKILEEGS